jgi:hypothetical protein
MVSSLRSTSTFLISQKGSGASTEQQRVTSPEDSFGLRVVVERKELETEITQRQVNIVFVHGLGGSARGTWTSEETGAFWPEWLPFVKHLEGARIMTFGYDADWTKVWRPNSTHDLSSFGDQLLNQLFLDFSKHGEVCIWAIPGR